MCLMRKRDAQLQEEGFHLLLSHAHEYAQQLMDEFVVAHRKTTPARKDNASEDTPYSGSL